MSSISPLPKYAERLTVLRQMSGFDSQSAFAFESGIGQSEWNHYETGRRMISLTAANRLRSRWGVTLDWIYHGDTSGLPVHLSETLRKIKAA